MWPQVFGLDGDGKSVVWEAVSRECVSLIQDLATRLSAKKGVVSSSASPRSPSPGFSRNGGQSGICGGAMEGSVVWLQVLR